MPTHREAAAPAPAITRGATVIRKADRNKPRPTRGTVERLVPPGTSSHRYPMARVRWHGNVRYLSGRTDQASTIKLDALVLVEPAP